MKTILPIFLILLFSFTSCVSDEPSPAHPSKCYYCNSSDFDFTESDIFNFHIPDMEVPDISRSSILNIYDEINEIDRRYAILLPESYDEDVSKNYPILYLLHGMGAIGSDWLNAADVKTAYDYSVSTGKLRDIIIVMPDAGETYYVDDYDGNIKYESYFFSQFLPFIEETYRIKPGKQFRMIAGCSMGGYGAAYYAFKYPELFGYCYVMSAVLEGKGVASTPSLIDVINNADSFYNLPLLTMDVGVYDQFLCMNENINSFFNELGLPHELIVREGSHNWQFWKESLYLAFERMGILLNLY